jgi:AraC-like DNA-binding protein
MPFLKETKAKLVDFSSHSVRFTGHSHKSDYEMILGLEGRIGIQLDKKRFYHMGPGDFILIPPDRFHWMWREEGRGSYYNHLIQADLRYLDQISQAGPFVLPSLQSYMRPLKEKLSQIPGGWGLLEDEFYFVWMAGLLERIIMNQSWTHTLTVPSNGGFEMKMRRLMADLIGDNPSERLSSEELAAAIGFERTYLTRKIKQYTGKSLMELYYEELFDQARVMLAGGASVKEGAYHFGFANPYHFSRKFKQVTGELPSKVTC